MTVPDLPDFCWPIDPGCLGDNWDEYAEEVQDRAVALAVGTLRRLTVNRVGGCPITVRPVPTHACGGLPLSRYGYGRPSRWEPYLQVDGSITNCGCGGATSFELKLPGYVGRVDQVKVDGVVVDPANYKLLDHDSIVWRGTGTSPWPHAQDMSKPDTEVGTYSVTYLPARPVDGLGANAAGVLAVEYAKACTGGKGCRLPKGTTAVVRAGVSINIISDTFPNGRTGIDEVDRWIALYNPRGATFQPTVWSPSSPQVRYET